MHNSIICDIGRDVPKYSKSGSDATAQALLSMDVGGFVDKHPLFVFNLMAIGLCLWSSHAYLIPSVVEGCKMTEEKVLSVMHDQDKSEAKKAYVAKVNKEYEVIEDNINEKWRIKLANKDSSNGHQLASLTSL